MPRLLHYSDLENAYDRPERIGRLAGTLARHRTPDTLVVGSGDQLAPGVLSLVTEGRNALSFFQQVQPDVETFGNHDFDYGLDAVREIVADSPQQWVAANVEYDGSVFGDGEGVQPSAVLTAGDERVGVVGVLDPATPSMSPGAGPLTVTDPVGSVERETERLEAAGVDCVVVLSHTGMDERIAQETAVDAVLGGHIHEPRIDSEAGTVLTRPGANGRHVAEVRLDPSSARLLDVDDAPPDPAVRDRLDEQMRSAGLDDVVATVDRPIPRDRDRRTSGECRAGNFLADAYRWAAGTDVALQNTGGIRGGPPLAGEVTVADLVGLVPFDEPVVVAELNGRELERLAYQADGTVVDGLSNYWHAHVSGMRIRHDGDAVSVWVDGNPVSEEETYTLATSAYLLDADHEFPVLTWDHLVETLDTQYELVVAYAREEGIDSTLKNRVVCQYDRGTAVEDIQE